MKTVSQNGAVVDFFNAKKRIADVKPLLGKRETKGSFRKKLLASIVGTDLATIDSILLQLIDESSDGTNDRYRLVENCNLTRYLWEQVRDTYGYESNNPSIIDFIHELFKECFNLEIGQKSSLRGDAKVFFRGWKNSSHYTTSFRHYSEVCEKDLDIPGTIISIDFRTLIGIDYFACIDRFIINNLINEIQERTISFDTISEYMRKQRTGFWYNQYIHTYKALYYASWFLKIIDEVNLNIDTLSDGISQYTSSYFRVDRLYRKYLFHVRESGQLGQMEKISTEIENRYSNKYLLKLNDRWQNLVDASQDWKIAGYTTQKNFYTHYILPIVQKERKVCVI
ncbi:MAG: BREX-1 system phosphatase PglZ type A, partial [Spirochaetia bacterium]|nr:BREX-1 system phosphatase PglZ type A [Spirochaetia bacterium]